MQPLARLRYEIARRPWIYWLTVAVTASIAAGALVDAVWRLDRERSRWGDTVSVLVATRDIAPGDPLAGAVRTRRDPVAVAPPGAVVPTVGAELHETVAVQHIAAGSVVDHVDIAVGTVPRSMLAPDQLAVAVTEQVRSGARVGDRVTVAVDGVVVARSATVVSLGEAVVLAVGADAAPRVAAAGGVALLIEP